MTITIIHINPRGAFDPRVPSAKERAKASWATKFCINLKDNYNHYRVESWKVYDPKDYGDMGVYELNEDNIAYKMFPGKSIGVKYISFSLLNELSKRIKKGEKIIIHLQTLHELMAYLISTKFSKSPIVAQQRAPTIPPLFKYRGTKKPFYILKHLIDSFCLRNYDYIFAPSRGEYKYLTKKLDNSKVIFLKGGGLDFNKNKLGNKKELREKLNLPLDSKIMIFVGRYNKGQGLHLVLDIYRRLKSEMKDVELIIIGKRDKEEPLYETVMNSGAITTDQIKNEEVLKYLNASDVSICPIDSNDSSIPFFVSFGDIGVWQIESASVNTPNISPLLIHFCGTDDERRKIGITVKNTRDCYNATKLILSKGIEFPESRDIIKKYYSWERILRKNVGIYKKLEKKYY